MTDTSENVEKLIKKRSSIKGQLTVCKNYLDVIGQISVSKLTNQQISELKIRLSKLDKNLTLFDSLQTDIEMSFDDCSEQLAEREVIENNFYSLMSKIQCILDAAHKLSGKRQSFSNTMVGNMSSFENCTSSNSIALPTIKLPTFDGCYNKWLEYRDTFTSLINSNESLSAINKFHYLRSSLEGGAASVIKSIEFCADNYDAAWNLLCDRYNNKRLLITNHVRALFSIESIIKESDISLRFIIDQVSKNLQALRNLDQPVDYWDTLVIYLITMKLDHLTSRLWEEHKCTLGEIPTLKEFMTFLRNRADFLETVKITKISKNERISNFVTSTHTPLNNNSNKTNCILCQQLHRLYECPSFVSMNLDDRHKLVSKHKLCINCLNSGHYANNCKYKPCKICKLKHNSLLHRTKVHNPVNGLQSFVSAHESRCTGDSGDTSALEPVSLSASVQVASQHIFLSTALVRVMNNCSNEVFVVRALLDSGSQITMITESLRAKLGLCTVKNERPTTVSGIGNMQLCLVDSCNFVMSSLNSKFSMNVHCMVVPRITSMLPNVRVNTDNLSIPKYILVDLADPQFFEPAEIDILIGADLYWDIVNGNQVRLGKGKPTLQYSSLGWLVCGPIGIKNSKGSNLICQLNIDISQQLQRFWIIEEISPDKLKSSDDEDFCESHFVVNTRRLQNGRFCVRIPFHTSPKTLGDSLHIAKQRFLNLEKRFKKQPLIRKLYVELIREYKELGHLSLSNEVNLGYYLPHHPVLREKSETTKLRVVFDASAKTSTGRSLNDIQGIGKVIQDDLFSILIRFRQHSFVFTGDITKMYRQIMVHDDDRQWQMIVWRENENEPLMHYKLNTVTYGTASVPFLSTRCLFQLAEECSDKCIAEIMKYDFYIDDILTGSESEHELQYICKIITMKLKEAGFELRKFRSNTNKLISENCLVDNKNLSDIKTSTGTLGLMWSPPSDVFVFPIHFKISENVTKRLILSMIAKIFDPLGLLSIFIVKAKIILQAIWKCKLDWDEIVTGEIKKMWEQFTKTVNTLSCISVPRHVLCRNVVSVELHLFSDASQSAYGSCCYTRSVDSEGQTHVKLLCAKSRVSPLKTLTIPRLELCGALLSAEMSAKIRKALRCQVVRCIHWTDSMVVLGWLRTSCTQRLNVFIANRVNKIKELAPNSEWKYVPTKDNPADLVSRGVESFDDRLATFWWGGPTFLAQSESEWPNEKYGPHMFCNDSSNVNCNVLHRLPMNEIISFSRYSTLGKLKRVLGYVLRFINNCKNPKVRQKSVILTVEELNSSMIALVKMAQLESFYSEIQVLKNNQSLPKRSNILSLNPFIDGVGIVRVGGRIQNSNFSYNKKHPILLDSKHRLSFLIFQEEHRRLLHAGPQLLLASVRENYWIVNSRNLARSIPHKCIICRRIGSKTLESIMGNLPKQRLTPGIPFESTGVDFAGPFYITDRKGRGCKISKCYLCVFVCFATKALHLEAVSDLSTAAFILTLKRFISRRGKPRYIFCDNGCNFVGAKNELEKFLFSNRDSVIQFSSDQGIAFHFSPPYAPHFGGLWEAGVKSSKFHLKRILGERHLTYEELATLFAQIEAILNSRPLCPLSSDPSDLSPLTPGHFLIGRPLTALPSENLTHIKISRLDRYEQLSQLKQHFWERWSSEYIAELQQRTKWRQQHPALKIGDMVVLKEDNLPPLKWRIGRVHALFPGTDGVSRVADVATGNGVVRRALTRLCPLWPPEDEKGLKTSSSTGEDVHACNT